MSKHKKVKAWGVVRKGVLIGGLHKTRDRARWMVGELKRYAEKERFGVHKIEYVILPNRKAR